MGFFDLFDTRESKVRGRVGQIQALASKLNADYYYGLDAVKNIFFSDIDEDMKNSNVIVGESEGYEYSFIEYYHVGHGKNDHSKWISKYSLRMNYEDFPDFTLQTRKSAILGASCLLVFSLFFCGIPLFIFLNFALAFFRDNKKVFSTGPGPLQVSSILMCGFFLLLLAIFVIIGYLIISSVIKTFRQINNQGQYYIRNPEFRQKYVILSDMDASLIRKVFTDEVCSRVVNYKPEIGSITIKNGCILGGFNYNEQLDYSNCLKTINNLVKEAQIFERDDEY